MLSVAALSVITSGFVGVTAAIIPAIIRKADRNHERSLKREEREDLRREHFWKLREALYLEMIRSISSVMAFVEHRELKMEGDPPELISNPHRAEVVVYASDSVRMLFETSVHAFQLWAGVAEPHPDDSDLDGDWYEFLQFVYGELVEGIRKELSDGRISLKGIGDPLESREMVQRYRQSLS